MTRDSQNRNHPFTAPNLPHLLICIKLHTKNIHIWWKYRGCKMRKVTLWFSVGPKWLWCVQTCRGTSSWQDSFLVTHSMAVEIFQSEPIDQWYAAHKYRHRALWPTHTFNLIYVIMPDSKTHSWAQGRELIPSAASRMDVYQRKARPSFQPASHQRTRHQPFSLGSACSKILCVAYLKLIDIFKDHWAQAHSLTTWG